MFVLAGFLCVILLCCYFYWSLASCFTVSLGFKTTVYYCSFELLDLPMNCLLYFTVIVVDSN